MRITARITNHFLHALLNKPPLGYFASGDSTFLCQVNMSFRILDMFIRTASSPPVLPQLDSIEEHGTHHTSPLLASSLHYLRPASLHRLSLASSLCCPPSLASFVFRTYFSRQRNSPPPYPRPSQTWMLANQSRLVPDLIELSTATLF